MSEYMLSKDYFVQVIRDLIVLAEDRKEYFTDLDSAIGDGDHGINLSIGFREVNKNIEDWKGLSVRDFYNKGRRFFSTTLWKLLYEVWTSN